MTLKDDISEAYQLVQEILTIMVDNMNLEHSLLKRYVKLSIKCKATATLLEKCVKGQSSK